jgi:hypothetical protein
VHKRTLDDIQKAVAALEQPQPSFPQVVTSLAHVGIEHMHTSCLKARGG